MKISFLLKLLPESNGVSENGRRLTAELIVETLAQSKATSLDELRAIWHTGLLSNGVHLKLTDSRQKNQREIWSIFQGRQLQRYILELFLRCFEVGLVNECRSVDEVVKYWLSMWEAAGGGSPPETFEDLLWAECQWMDDRSEFEMLSSLWNEQVHMGHSAYDWIDEGGFEDLCLRACRMMARWWLRTLCWSEQYEQNKELLGLGGRERISMQWLVQWIDERKSCPLPEFLREVFSDLVFSQHVRVALYRFDGQVQRLRFMLGDDGIVATSSAAAKLGKNPPPWMEDRLASFTNLLCDLSVLKWGDDGTIALGDKPIKSAGTGD